MNARRIVAARNALVVVMVYFLGFIMGALWPDAPCTPVDPTGYTVPYTVIPGPM